MRGPLLWGDLRHRISEATSLDLLCFAAFFATGFAGSLLLTLYVGFQDSPDASLYTSGLSLFPSPLGTAVGTLVGVEGLAIIQASAVGLVAMTLVALRVPLLSVVVALPVLIWIAPLSVNVIAATLFAWGWLRGQPRWYWIAAGFHLSILLLIVALARVRVAALAILVGVVLLLSTRYRAGLEVGSELERVPQAVLGGLLVGTLALVPGVVAGAAVTRRPLLGLGIAVAVGTAYAVRFDLSDGYVLWTSLPQTFRYAMPVVFVCFIESALRSRRAALEYEVDALRVQ